MVETAKVENSALRRKILSVLGSLGYRRSETLGFIEFETAKISGDF
jgi:hypothetical protein